jgi:ArsR family transcriptional regulator, lead/cadmium/zinc/bismuth-responsive transcriptional repressor
MVSNLIDRNETKKTADCSAFQPHEGRIESARAAKIDDELLVRLGELFKIFSDTTRLRILGALAGGELCVCDIGEVLGASQSAVSHQLAVLRAARLVAFRREGKTVYYRLADDHVGHLLDVALEHASESRQGPRFQPLPEAAQALAKGSSDGR